MLIRQRFNVWTLTVGPPFWETFNKILIRQRLNVWTLTEGLGPPFWETFKLNVNPATFQRLDPHRGFGSPFLGNL